MLKEAFFPMIAEVFCNLNIFQNEVENAEALKLGFLFLLLQLIWKNIRESYHADMRENTNFFGQLLSRDSSNIAFFVVAVPDFFFAVILV